MNDETTVNLIVAMARILKVDYKDLALAFNNKTENQKYFDDLRNFQQVNAKKEC